MFKINKNNDKYKALKNYIESKDYEEENLEKLLKKEREFIKEEEYNIYKNSYDKIISNVLNDLNLNNKLISEKSMIYKENKKNRKLNEFIISRCADVLECFYLIINKEDIDDDFFLTTVKLQFNSQFNSKTIFEASITYCIMECIINGYYIKYDEEYIQVPIFNFNKFTSYYKGYEIKGYCFLTYLLTEINISFKNNKNINKYFEKAIFSCYFLNTNIRMFLLNNFHKKSLIIDNNYLKFNKHINNTFLELKNCEIKGWVKCFLVTFHSKNFLYENNSIESFNLVLGHKRYKIDDINEIEILNKNVYMISLSNEFNSLENMKNLFENNNNMTNEGIDFDNINQKINIEIETTQNMEFFDFDIIQLGINIIIHKQEYKEFCTATKLF